MNSRELSDLDRDALTITTRQDQTWITCTSDGQEVTVGPIPTHQITGALPAHAIDGDVTVALPVSPARPGWQVESAERIRGSIWGIGEPDESEAVGEFLADRLARHGYKVVPVADDFAALEDTEQPMKDAPRADWLAARDQWNGGAA